MTMPTPFPLASPAGRVVLRPLQTRDIADFVAYRSDPEIARYQSWENFSERQAHQLLELQRLLPFGTDESWFQLAVTDAAEGRLLGDIGLHFIDEGRQMELGITFSRQHQGQGFATEALSTLIDDLFTQQNKHRITATVDVRNLASQRLFQRLGFRQEAHHLQCSWMKGEWVDEYQFALLSHQWPVGGTMVQRESVRVKGGK